MISLIFRATSNTRGIRMGLLGAGLGLISALMSGHLAVGLFAAGVWWILSVLPRVNVSGEPLPKRQIPWFFLLPLPVWGLVALFLIAPVSSVEKARALKNQDPRLLQLRTDESLLSANRVSGATDLSNPVSEALAPMTAGMDGVHVFARRQKTFAIVLVKIPTLSAVTEDSRAKLLDAIDLAIAANGVDSSHIFIGPKGQFFYGAVQTPGGVKSIGKILDEAGLVQFYGEPPTLLATQNVQ